MVRFDSRTILPVDRATAFDLSLSIDAHLDSFERSGERAVGGVTHGVIGLGEFVTWRARHFGINWTMTSHITAWERPDRFVDEQQRGPFRSFHHEHRFRSTQGGTEMHDIVTFEAPLGPLGRIAERAGPRLVPPPAHRRPQPVPGHRGEADRLPVDATAGHADPADTAGSPSPPPSPPPPASGPSPSPSPSPSPNDDD